MALLRTNTGIGTTNPTSALHVIGDVLVTGVVTATTFNGNINTGVATITTAIITDLTNTRMTSGIGTINNITNNFINSGVGTVNILNTGIGTVNNLNNTFLNVSGVGSIATLNSSTANINVGVITDLTNTRLTSGIGTINNITNNFINSGVGTVNILNTGIGTINNLNSTFLNVSGIGSIATLNSPTANINVGVITDLTNTRFTSGIATITNLISTASTITNLTGTNATITRIDSTHINAGIVTATQLSTGAIGSSINITSDSITGPSSIVIDPAGVGDNTGAVRIKGDLYVDGDQFYVNSGTIELADLRVGIATTVGSNLLLDGGGIGIGSANILKTFTYNYASDSLKSSENLDINIGKTYKINGTDVLSSNTLGSGVIYSSLQYLGTLNNLNVSGLSTLPTLVGTYATITEIDNSRFLSGISSITNLYASNGYINVGVVTDLTNTRLTSGIGTINNITNNFINSGVGTVNILNVGIGTVTDLNSTLLNVSGVGTIATLNSTYTNLTNINSTGISTIADIRAQRVTVTGIVTANSFRPTSGYIQAADGTNSFYIYNSTGNVAFQGTIGVNQINNGGGYQVITFNNIDTRLTGNLDITGVTTSSVFNGNIYSLGVSTFRNGPVLIGTGTSTGTASQPLQVIGGAYVSNNIGIGSTTPGSNLDVIGNAYVSGVVTATTFNGQINSGVATITSISSTYLNSGIGTITDLTNTRFTSGISTIINLDVTREVVGTSTITTLYASTANINVGVVTDISGTRLNYTGVGTITTFNSNTGTINNLTSNYNTTGVGTVNILNSGIGTINDLNNTRLVSGIATITTLYASTGNINVGVITDLTNTRFTSGIATITNLDVTREVVGTSTITTLYASVGNINVGVITDLTNTRFTSGVATITSLNSTNIISTNSDFTNLNANNAYIDVGIVTDISGTRLNYTGVGTIATLNSTRATITEIENTDINVTGIATIQNLNVLGNFDVYDTTATFHNNVFISGNLSIGGTSSIITAQDLNILDKEITLGVTTNAFNQDVSTDITANHGGISIASTQGYPLVDLSLAGFSSIPKTYKQLMWVAANSYGVGTTDAWMFNYAVGIGSTQVPTDVRLAVGEVQITDHQINATTGEFDRIESGIATITGADITNLNSNNIYSQSGIITDLSGTRLTYTGFGTITNLYSENGNINVGVITNLTNTRMTSGIATITNLNVTNSTFTNANVGNLFAVTGIVTTLSSTNATLTNINSTGISTLNILRTSTINSTGVVTAPTFVGDLLGVANYAHVAGFSTFSGYANNAGLSTFAWNAGVSTSVIGGIASVTQLQVTGISTLGIVTANNLYVSGVSTLSSLHAPRLTYNGSDYGNLSGYVPVADGAGGWTWSSVTSTFSVNNILNGFNVFDEGSVVGTAGSITTLDFRGNNITAIANLQPNGIATITVSDTPSFLSLTVTPGDTILGITTSTSLSANQLSVAGLSTFIGVSTFQNDLYVGGNLYVQNDLVFDEFTARNANITGISTLGIASATSVYVTGIVTATQFSTGAVGSAINITNNSITGPSSIVIDPAAVGDDTGAVRIKGDLYVDGTQFVVNSTTIEFADFNVGIATTVGSNLLLDGAGIGIGSANIRKTLTYDFTNDALKSSENFNIPSGKTYKINGVDVLSSTTLGSGVVNSSLTSVGTLGQLNVSGVTTSSGGFVGNLTGNASSATYAVTAGVATYAGLAGIATYANNAGIATYAWTAGVSTYSGVAGVSTFSGYANNAGIATYAWTAGVSTYSGLAGVSTSVIGGIASVTQLNVSGVGTVGSLNIGATQVISSGRELQNIVSLDATTTATIENAIANAPNIFTDIQVTGVSTFTNGPVIIGSGTSTGTLSQPLQVTGGSYVSGNLGVGTTNPQYKLDVLGNINFTGSLFQNGSRFTSGIGIGSTSVNPQSGVISQRVGTGFTDLNIVGTGISVTGYGSTVVIDFGNIAAASGGALSISTVFAPRIQDVTFVGGATTSRIGISTQTDRFVYDTQTGSVGIGTFGSSIPSYKLDVIGDINSSTSVKIKGVDVLEEAVRLAIALG